MSQAKKRLLLAVTLAEHGGVQEFLIRFAIYLRDQGHEVSLAAGDGEWLFDACKKHGLPAHRLHHLHRSIHPWHDVRAVQEFTQLLRKIQPDAVHLNSSKMGAIGAFAAHHVRTPNTVYRIGGWVFLEPLPFLTRGLYRLIEKISARWKDTIICVHPGDETVARALHIRPKQALRTIPNGIDLESFSLKLLDRRAARQKLGLDEHSFVFGTIANLFPAKDLPRYLQACAKVHKSHPESRFIIVGEGMERKAIEETRKTLGLDQVVHLPGRVPEASSLLKAFDAFVLPSAKEGMSWALLEAMATPLPCVATDVGANRWLLQNEAGWIVPAQDPDALAEAMKTVITCPPEAKQRAHNGYIRIATDFPLKKTFQENEKALLS